MNEMITNLINTKMGPGILVTIGGVFGVFFVLILFYLIIRLLTALFPYKPEV